MQDLALPSDEVLALQLPQDLYVNPADRERLRTQYELREKLEGTELGWKKKDGAQIVVNLYEQTILDANGGVIG